MTPLVPLMMFGWIIVSISAFKRMKPDEAVILVAVGGVLFLPMYSFDLPLLPEYNKVSAISWSLIAGEFFGGVKKDFQYKRTSLDLPIVLLCFVSPVATSLSNGLGLYDGVSNAVQNYLNWGVFFWLGRRYFVSSASLRKLTIAVIVGGCLYFPLMAFEVRMSPQLSRIFYGFFPHSFLQHIRYGGFRPIVFMQHGLMVALWSAAAAISAFWLWRSGEVKRIKNVPIVWAVLVLIAGTLLCKSVGAMILMAVGLVLVFPFLKSGNVFFIKLALLAAVFYIVFRVSDVLPISVIEETLVKYFDPERVQSAMMRMHEEELFGARTALRPIFGWGGYQRGWPIDPDTGETLIGMIDALWTILYNTYGFFGLATAGLSLGVGPWSAIRRCERSKRLGSGEGKAQDIDAVILSLIVTLFILDCLLNAMHNPVYIVMTGALVSYALRSAEPEEDKNDR